MLLCPDPDPHSQYESGSKTAKWMWIHVDPDPQHWIKNVCFFKKQFYFIYILGRGKAALQELDIYLTTESR
jgi:hypothetical protein